MAAAASVAYLHPLGTSLVGTLASTLGTPTPTYYLPPGRLPALLEPPTYTSSPRTGGVVGRGAIRVVVERFGGLNDHPPLGLIASVGISDPTVVNQILTQLNHLPPFPGGIFCPLDDGSYFELIFTYVDGTTVNVKVAASGCGEVFVGDSTQPVAWTATSPKFVAILQGVFGPASGPGA
ncbi:MAG TPA: hypothetical protein VNU19_05345 [Candidatus Acidoferrum sp.]|nr:hypothetical protein [Candidatus Acidoferrum sp.]